MKVILRNDLDNALSIAMRVKQVLVFLILHLMTN
jgi:hypothetical protein